MSEDGGGVRLAKRVAELKACSRAEAERYIEGGWVSVNGEVVELPQHRVAEADTVAIAPDARATTLLPATVLWHKPAGVRCDIDQAPKAEWLTAEQRARDDRSGQRLLLNRSVTSAISSPPLRIPAASAAPIEPKKKKASVPIREARTTTPVASTGPCSMIQSTGATTARGIPVAIQCASVLARAMPSMPMPEPA